MARPDRSKNYFQLPATAGSVLDTAPAVRTALDNLDLGYFRDAALLVEQMMRDDRIRGVVGQRVDALISSPVEVAPGRTGAKAERLAREMEGYEEDGGAVVSGQWKQIAQPAEAWRLSFWGLMIGVAVAEQVYTTTDKRWTPHLVSWHPQFLRWDWASNSYKLMTMNRGEIELPRLDEPGYVSDGRWVVWCPYGYREGWKFSAVKWLADKFIMRGWDYRDWARYNEAHGQPKMVAMVPERAKEEDQDAFAESLRTANGEMVITIPIGEGGPDAGWGVKMLEPTARTFDSFNLFKSTLDTDIAIGMLGQNLTTQVDGGSRAAAQEHTLVRIDKALFDAGLADCLRDQVIVPWARFNFNDETLAPKPKYAVEPAEDENAEATAMGAVGEAAQLLAGASPRFNAEAFLERFGVPMYTDEELADQAAAGASDQLDLTPSAQGAVISVNEARRSKGLGPLMTDGGAEDPDGHLSVAEYLAKHAEMLAAAADAADPAGTSNAPEGAQGAPSHGGDGEGETPPGGSGPGAGRAPGGVDGEGDADKPSRAALSDMATALVKRYVFAGLPIAIENPAGSVRTWTDEAGQQTGHTLMRHDYGFIEGHLGADGEEVDVYVGPEEGARDVHVVRQYAKPDYKRYDEDKVFLGFASAEDARAAYAAHRDDGEAAIGAVLSIPLARFKTSLRRRGSGPIRARIDNVKVLVAWQREQVAAETALTSLMDRAAALRATGGRTAAGARRARLYGDRLADKGMKHAARVLAPDLAALRSVVDGATDFEDLSRKLIAHYRGSMDPARLAALVQRTRLMGNLGGQLAAVKRTKRR